MIGVTLRGSVCDMAKRSRCHFRTTHSKIFKLSSTRKLHSFIVKPTFGPKREALRRLEANRHFSALPTDNLLMRCWSETSNIGGNQWLGTLFRHGCYSCVSLQKHQRCEIDVSCEVLGRIDSQSIPMGIFVYKYFSRLPVLAA